VTVWWFWQEHNGWFRAEAHWGGEIATAALKAWALHERSVNGYLAARGGTTGTPRSVGPDDLERLGRPVVWAAYLTLDGADMASTHVAVVEHPGGFVAMKREPAGWVVAGRVDAVIIFKHCARERHSALLAVRGAADLWREMFMALDDHCCACAQADTNKQAECMGRLAAAKRKLYDIGEKV
jgi:hypothetical protein